MCWMRLEGNRCSVLAGHLCSLALTLHSSVSRLTMIFAFLKTYFNHVFSMSFFKSVLALFLPLLCSSSNSLSLHLNITFSNPLGKHTPSVHNTLLPWLPFCNIFPVQSDRDHSLPFSLSACVLCWDSSRHASRASWRCAESISSAGREPG